MIDLVSFLFIIHYSSNKQLVNLSTSTPPPPLDATRAASYDADREKLIESTAFLKGQFQAAKRKSLSVGEKAQLLRGKLRAAEKTIKVKEATVEQKELLAKIQEERTTRL